VALHAGLQAGRRARGAGGARTRGRRARGPGAHAGARDGARDGARGGARQRGLAGARAPPEA